VNADRDPRDARLLEWPDELLPSSKAQLTDEELKQFQRDVWSKMAAPIFGIRVLCYGPTDLIWDDENA
jgi:hypothetical protein